MPEKYLRHGGVPILLRHTGGATLPERAPASLAARSVVCLHDAGLQSSFFVDLLAARAALRGERAGASADACSLAFDLPGHGRSGGLDALPSIEAMSDCARSVAGWCRAGRPILVGHGMGALVALDWARRDPGTLGGLVLCGTGSGFGVRDEAIAAMREVTLGRAPRPFDPKRLAPGSAPELMRRAYFESIQTDPRATLGDLEASRAFARAASKHDDESPLASTLPILVVAGECEPESDLEAARALAQSLGARFSTVAQAAHWLPFERPAALAAEIATLAEAA